MSKVFEKRPKMYDLGSSDCAVRFDVRILTTQERQILLVKFYLFLCISLLSALALLNPLMPGGNKKVTHS